MAVTAQEQTALETRWGMNLGDNRPKVTKALLVHVMTLQLIVMRHTNTNAQQFQTAFDDALALVNSKTEDSRGLK
jgi:hypothetical protein